MHLPFHFTNAEFSPCPLVFCHQGKQEGFVSRFLQVLVKPELHIHWVSTLLKYCSFPKINAFAPISKCPLLSFSRNVICNWFYSRVCKHLDFLQTLQYVSFVSIMKFTLWKWQSESVILQTCWVFVEERDCSVSI